MGIWRTLRDDFFEFGSKNPNDEYDRHWQKDTHAAFARMIVKEFNLRKPNLI